MSDPARSMLDEDDLFAGGDVVPMRLGDAVIQRITQAIHDGRLKPGDSLPSEARIAASFGVSKPIAREAIRQLAAMGVVHIQQGKPTRVQALDAAPLDRFYRFAVRGRANGLTEAVELRRILEPPIAAHSAERRMERQLIQEYRQTVETLLAHLSPANLAQAAGIAALPEQVRGFGHVKAASVANYRKRLQQMLQHYGPPASPKVSLRKSA